MGKWKSLVFWMGNDLGKWNEDRSLRRRMADFSGEPDPMNLGETKPTNLTEV